MAWPDTPTTFVLKNRKKWSLIINNDACLLVCGLFIIYLYCLLTGCFCLLKRSDWTLRTSWARPRSQLKHCPLSTIQNNIFTVCGGRVLANPAPLTLNPQLFMRFRIRIQPGGSKICLKFLNKNILIRPLGKVLYFYPVVFNQNMNNLSLTTFLPFAICGALYAKIRKLMILHLTKIQVMFSFT